MSKRLNIFRWITFIFGLAQVLFIAFVTISIIAGWQEFIQTFHLLPAIVVFSLLVLADIVMLAIFVIVIARLRRVNDLSVGKLLNSNIDTIYDFGQIGILVVDRDNLIIWESDLFAERHLDLVDTNILEWQPELRVFTEPNAIISKPLKLNINGRFYEVKYQKENGVYIFKDITEYEDAYSYAKNQSLVLGLISLDNYEDVVGDDENNDTLLQIREKLSKYMESYDALIKKIRSDTFLLIANFKAYKKMEEEKFRILQDIREFGKNDGSLVTISMGIAYGYPDIESANDEANQALEMAMARGGDQVVVKQYGQEMSVFGAVTETQEKRSRVKVRVLSDSLLSLLREASNLCIVGHVNMDMDCLGGALGLYTLAKFAKCPVNIVYDPKLTEAKTRQAVRNNFSKEEISNIFISPADALSRIKPKTLVFLVDLHSPEMSLAPKLFAKAKRVGIIDHHRRTAELSLETLYTYFETSSSSASELLTELIYFASAAPRIGIEPRIATIMFAGILLDSNDFRTKTTGVRTFEAATVLKENGADNVTASELLKDDFDEYLLINGIMATLKTISPGIVYCTAGEQIVEREVLSKVANQCMQLKDITASFALGHTASKEIRISARSDSSVNVQVIMEKLGGGGHLAAASALIKEQNIVEVEKNLIEAVNVKLEEERLARGKDK